MNENKLLNHESLHRERGELGKKDSEQWAWHKGPFINYDKNLIFDIRRFRNNYDQNIKMQYKLPLPADANWMPAMQHKRNAHNITRDIFQVKIL